MSEFAFNLSQKCFGITTLNIDFIDNTFINESFNLLTCVAFIEHVTDPLKYIVEMNRILKIGGYLFISIPNIHRLSLRYGIEGYFKIVHLYYYSFTTLSNLLKKCGFDIISVRDRSIYTGFSNLNGELDILAQKRYNVNLRETRENKLVLSKKEKTRTKNIIKSVSKYDKWFFPTNGNDIRLIINYIVRNFIFFKDYLNNFLSFK